MSLLTNHISSLSTLSFNLSPKSKNNNLVNFDLEKLEDNNLDAFFLFHDKSASSDEKISKSHVNLKSTDLFHYIWMGNPLPIKYQENILKLKSLYPNKKFILWVDEEALKYPEILKFAKDNNICLILLSDVFKEKYSFELNEIIEIEKNRLPPNWAAVSDVYRYLIMYYFAGTYLDTDRDPNVIELFKNETNIETLIKEISLVKKDYNDVIIVKKRKTQFFENILLEIKKKYNEKCDYRYYCIAKRTLYKRSYRLFSTLNKTGPFMLSNFSELIFNNINWLQAKGLQHDFSWKGTLSDDIIENLIKNKNIESNIILNIIQELKERGILNLIRYDKIIDKLDKDARKRILNKVLEKLTELADKPDFEIEYLIAKNKEEYNEVIKNIPKKLIKIKSIFLALKKAIKTKNTEMIGFLLDFLDKETIKELSDKELPMLIATAFLTDKKILNIFIETITKKNIYIDLEKTFDFLFKHSYDQSKPINSEDLEDFIKVLDNKKLNPYYAISKLMKLYKSGYRELLVYIAKNKPLFECIYNKLNDEDKRLIAYLL